MENVKERYYQVDVLRFVCAILVISIHTSALYSFGDVPGKVLSLGIARIAVPFFFIASGYFFYERFNNEGYLKAYIIRILKYYLISTVVYTVILFSFIKSRNSNILELVKNLLFNGVSPSLWFFPALIFSISVLYLFLKKNWIKPLVIVSLVLYALGLIGDSYYGLVVGTPLENLVEMYSAVFVYTRNGLCFGLPFLTLGVLISKYDMKNKLKHLKALTLFSAVIFASEAYVLISNNISRDNNMYISLIFLVSCIFLLSLRSKKVLSDRKAKLLRDMSLWIYCLHELLQFLVYGLLPKVSSNSFLVFLMVTLVVVPLSYFIVRKKVPFYTLNKKKEIRLMASLLVVALIIGLVSSKGPSKTTNSNGISPSIDLKLDENAPSSNIVGPMWKISSGTSSIYLYGSLDVGDKNLYPLSPKVEEAFKSSEALALEVELDKIDGPKINNKLLYEKGDNVENHVSSDAIDIYKEKVSYFKADYDKVKQFKASYLAQNCISVYLAQAKVDQAYIPDIYFLYSARKTDKPVVSIGDIYKLYDDLANPPDEVGDASLKLLKYYNEDSTKKSLDRLEAWKKSDLEAIEKSYDEQYIVPESEKENFTKLNTLVNNYDQSLYSKLKSEYSSKIDGYIKENKNYFIVLSTNYLQGDDSILKQLEQKGYHLEKIN
ncbi:acyltransferase family protein [Clostridium intestinale]|uniref:acyltransferase family protein n=1 Tax=Clostridium intestinale TaxID=36845 RepID=UPI002DD65249|nr:acyltransferase family protein [Clostridium intestinale]WRY52188.1 TraB/GumN family protein [Clostridium intestinale]